MIEQEQIVIKIGPNKGVYSVHPVARFFPLLNGDAFKELKASISEMGQQEPVVLDGTDLLDGRNRVAALNDLGMAPLVVQFVDLQTGFDQGVWIAAKNLQRRHLTDDQYLAITARYFEWLKELDQKSPLTTNAQEPHAPVSGGGVEVTNDHQVPGEYPQKPAANATRRKRGRPRGQRSEAEALAGKTKQSRYRAERVLRIRNHSPELAVAVAEGRMTLKEADAQIPKTDPDSLQRNVVDGSAKTELPPENSKIERAAVRAIDHTRAVAKELRKSEQPTFWQEIASRAQAILRFEFPEVDAGLANNTNTPASPAAKSKSREAAPNHDIEEPRTPMKNDK